MSSIKSGASANSYATSRIEPFDYHSRVRATAEEADQLGNNDGRVTQAEIELLADKYDDMGHTHAASEVRAAWDRLEQNGVSGVGATVAGGTFRGVLGFFEAIGDRMFENVR